MSGCLPSSVESAMPSVSEGSAARKPARWTRQISRCASPVCITRTVSRANAGVQLRSASYPSALDLNLVSSRRAHNRMPVAPAVATDVRWGRKKGATIGRVERRMTEPERAARVGRRTAWRTTQRLDRDLEKARRACPRRPTTIRAYFGPAGKRRSTGRTSVRRIAISAHSRCQSRGFPT